MNHDTHIKANNGKIFPDGPDNIMPQSKDFILHICNIKSLAFN